jgi:hypothetical protein
MFVYHSGHLWIVRGFSTIEVYPIVQFDCPVEEIVFPFRQRYMTAFNEGVLRHVFRHFDMVVIFATLDELLVFDLLLMIRIGLASDVCSMLHVHVLQTEGRMPRFFRDMYVHCTARREKKLPYE